MQPIRYLAIVASVILLPALHHADSSEEMVFDGVIRPNKKIILRSAVDGILENVHVDRGSAVRTGQVVATLEFKVEKANLDLAQERAVQRADLERARAELEFAKLRLERHESLLKKGVVERDVVDEMRSEFRLAEIKVSQELESIRVAKLEHARSKAQWEQREIRSPMAGIISQRLRSPGEMVTRSVDSPILELISIDPLEIDVRLPIELYRSIRRGQKAEVQIVGFDDLELEATVSHIDPQADVASGTFGIRLSLPNADGRLPSGLRCHVTLGRK